MHLGFLDFIQHRYPNLFFSEVVLALIPLIKDGAKIVELCATGDRLIEEGVSTIYNKNKAVKVDKGIAFPTCISVNNVVGHFSPLSDDTSVIRAGDIVKMYAFDI